jgi:hypothetical protein
MIDVESNTVKPSVDTAGCEQKIEKARQSGGLFLRSEVLETHFLSAIRQQLFISLLPDKTLRPQEWMAHNGLTRIEAKRFGRRYNA